MAYGLLQLGALARFGDQVQWHEPGTWIWAALLINAIVTGGYQLLDTAGGTAQGSPRSSASDSEAQPGGSGCPAGGSRAARGSPMARADPGLLHTAGRTSTTLVCQALTLIRMIETTPVAYRPPKASSFVADRQPPGPTVKMTFWPMRSSWRIADSCTP